MKPAKRERAVKRERTLTKKRFCIAPDFWDGLGDGKSDWGVYDEQRNSKRPLAVFAKRSHARWFAEYLQHKANAANVKHARQPGAQTR